MPKTINSETTEIIENISHNTLQPQNLYNNSKEVLNFNIGILGHVDSGKTSLVKTLSTVLSTACLDKSSQSKQRGITLDLGFSAFIIPLPNNIKTPKSSLMKYHRNLQVTLVDCPGHASLIRTIIGGSQIIDMVLLVIDATKGMQTQTWECLSIAEIFSQNIIIALNKIDLFPKADRSICLQKMENNIRKVLSETTYKDSPIVGVSASIGAANGSNCSKSFLSSNISGLLNIIQSHIIPPSRWFSNNPAPNFHFSIDHCFSIKGRGTILTGTCISGSISTNDQIEFPTLSMKRKIKSIQVFRQNVTNIKQGDRAGICISNFSPSLMERGISCSPSYMKLWYGGIALVRKARYFNGELKSGTKFHISVGHCTIMADVKFWGYNELEYRLKMNGEEKNILNSSFLSDEGNSNHFPSLQFNYNESFLYQEKYKDTLTINKGSNNDLTIFPLHWASLDFQAPIYCPVNSLIIGSRLDVCSYSQQKSSKFSRLSFSGRLTERFASKGDVSQLRLYITKEKRGIVCRLGDAYRRTDDGMIIRYEIYGKDLFQKQTNVNEFIGLRVITEESDVGIIRSSYGTSGKFKIEFPGGTCAKEGDILFLRFRRYIYDSEKKIYQSYKELVLPEKADSVRLSDENISKNVNKSVCALKMHTDDKNIIINNSHNKTKSRQSLFTEIRNINVSEFPTFENKKACIVNDAMDAIMKSSLKSSLSNTQSEELRSIISAAIVESITAFVSPAPLSDKLKLPPTSMYIPTVNVNSGMNSIVGVIERMKGEKMSDGRYLRVIVTGLFTPDQSIHKMKGTKVRLIQNRKKCFMKFENECVQTVNGYIVASFGKRGKCQVEFPNGGLSVSDIGSKVEMLFP